MNWITRLFSRRRLYSDLCDEIQEHLAEKIDEVVASGVSSEEATLAARREFGNATLIEERGREAWQWSTIENVLMDVRYALRTLRRSSSFSTVAVLILVLGIGANTAIFSIINGLMLRTLPTSAIRSAISSRFLCIRWSTPQPSRRTIAPFAVSNTAIARRPTDALPDGFRSDARAFHLPAGSP